MAGGFYMEGLRLFFGSVLVVLIIFVLYTIWDNHRIFVAKEDIVIRKLPQQLEDLKIVQISDLHEREFGKNQKRLLKIINSLDYDVIVFTGDMLDNRKSTNYQPFYSILEGIENKENVFVVPGNADAPSYDYYPDLKKSDFVKGIEKRGATFLESFTTFDKKGATIHFVDFEMAIIDNPDHIGKTNGSFQARFPTNEQYKSYQQKLWNEMIDPQIFDDENIIIALNHFPVPDPRVDFIHSDPHTVWRDFDLIIAGHYHGGQIRLPFLGAIFIPDPWYEPNSFFPPQNRVKGLWEYQETKQYVSVGLGTSDAIPFLKFRLFNPPEINVLTLKSK